MKVSKVCLVVAEQLAPFLGHPVYGTAFVLGCATWILVILGSCLIKLFMCFYYVNRRSRITAHRSHRKYHKLKEQGTGYVNPRGTWKRPMKDPMEALKRHFMTSLSKMLFLVRVRSAYKHSFIISILQTLSDIRFVSINPYSPGC